MGDIFINLLNMSITAGWLILAVLGIRFLFRKIPKWVICLLWGVVAIRLIFPFSIESEFSLLPSAEPIKSSAVVGGEVMPYIPSVDSNLDIVENTVNPILAETFAYKETESIAPLQVFTEAAGNVWLCGMIGLLIFAVISVFRLRLCVREAVRYKANIYICDAVKSPFILGIIKPKIYLSSALSGEKKDYIIAHEKVHLSRCDHLWKPFGYLLLCIYWFNPLCWIAYMMLCRDIELACDEKVIKNMSFEAKKEYSRVLLSCATQRRPVSVCPLAFGEVGVRERVKSVLNYKKPTFWITMLAIVVCVIVAICFLTNPLAEDAESENDIYEKVVAGLGDDDTYAFLEMNYDNMVMLTSDLVYDTGTEKQAAVYCDIYYYVDKDAKMLGTIMSDGTAYPITFTEDGIFAASGHKIEKYVISEEGSLFLEKGIYEQFDEAGNVRYISMMGEQESESTEQEYQEMVNEYGRSQIVHFSYGAEGSVNEYQESAAALGTEESDIDGEGVCEEIINIEKRDVTHDGVADYIVTSMTYDTADVDMNAAQSERITQQIMYGLVCVKVYEGDNASDTYSEEKLLWSQEYSRVHTGNGQLSVVRMDDKDYLLTSSLWAGQGFAAWEFEVFSLNEMGDKEVIDKQSVEFKLNEDDSADEECYAEYNHSLEEYIADGILIVACDIDFEQQFIRTQESQYIPQDYYSNALVKFDNMEDEQEQYTENTAEIIKENTEKPVEQITEENTEKSVAETTRVDTSEISGIVVKNGNTGEQITLTAEASAYKDLLKLYWQLDFTAEYEENTRVGYQYKMKLLDADGNKLQSVTPYKDGLIVDRIFYKYDNTGEAAEASIRLMGYLESVFDTEVNLQSSQKVESGVIEAYDYSPESENSLCNITDVTGLYELLNSLDYKAVTSDGLPEYKVTFDNKDTFSLNITDRWVRIDKEKEAQLSDNEITILMSCIDISG